MDGRVGDRIEWLRDLPLDGLERIWIIVIDRAVGEASMILCEQNQDV
jgi:hypothetical protein